MVPKIIRRHFIQWLLLWPVLITIGLGWKYPLLGYTVPVVMLAGLLGSLVRGRYVCGNLCPRGSFLDRIMPTFSRQGAIPTALRSMPWRWTVFTLLMGFMLYRGGQDPTNLNHWGHIFWQMCVLTTGVAILLAIVYKPRTWCSFCPIGTCQNALGGHHGQLRIDPELCKNCRLCEKSCPFELKITRHREAGHLPSRDCLKCSECIRRCPAQALSWPPP